jgi:hypothetical protein
MSKKAERGIYYVFGNQKKNIFHHRYRRVFNLVCAGIPTAMFGMGGQIDPFRRHGIWDFPIFPIPFDCQRFSNGDSGNRTF